MEGDDEGVESEEEDGGDEEGDDETVACAESASREAVDGEFVMAHGGLGRGGTALTGEENGAERLGDWFIDGPEELYCCLRAVDRLCVVDDAMEEGSFKEGMHEPDRPDKLGDIEASGDGEERDIDATNLDTIADGEDMPCVAVIAATTGLL